MKRFLTIVAIFMTMLCGSVFLVSCSRGYKKMYLEIEWAVPIVGEGEPKFHKVDPSKGFDFTLSENGYKEDGAHVLFLRINVKGTSKKVESLYISQTANTSTLLEGNTVKPNEVFKVKVKNFGSVRFTVVPSHGGDDKAVSFGMNIYKELTGIEQNTNCVPAVVTGGYIELEKLSNLISYTPQIGETNQTGVDYKIEAIGSLVNDGSNNLLGRRFVKNDDFDFEEGLEGYKIAHKNPDNQDEYVSLDTVTGSLVLNISQNYSLTTSNNVIRLRATSQYHNPDKDVVGEDGEISTIIYAYIVENFYPSSLLVSYSPDIKVVNGVVPTEGALPIDNEITIYNSSSVNTGEEYNAMSIYTYTNASIYSYETNPGIKLNVSINGVDYDYTVPSSNNLGISVSPVYKEEYGASKLIGLKFKVNPNAETMLESYRVRIELDFTSFDFSASDKTPVSVLNKEFTINVKSLASAIYINGKSYSDNVAKNVANNEQIVPGGITGHEPGKPAKLYTAYAGKPIGMPLNIQATPTNAINTKVYVGFYKDCPTVSNGELALGGNLIGNLQLYQSSTSSLKPNDDKDDDNYGLFEIDFYDKNKVVYLAFNKNANTNLELRYLEKIYMVCKVVCTPNSFGLDQDIEQRYITYVASIDVVPATDTIYVYKNVDNNVTSDTLTDDYLANATINTAYINFNTTSSNVDLSQIKIASLNGNIKYSADKAGWNDSIIAKDLKDVNNSTYKVIYFKTDIECNDSIVITSDNGVNKALNFDFVNVTPKADAVEIKYDNAYIESFGEDKVGLYGVTVGENIELKYLALQSGRTVQFRAFGDSKNSTIYGVAAKSLYVSSAEYVNIIKGDEPLYTDGKLSTFSPNAVKVLNSGEYIFDVSANSVGFTSILFVKVDFYLSIDGVIKPQSKYFVFEVAVYNPVRDLKVNTDKDSIIYINEHYTDVATVNFTISTNRATRNIVFSSQTINNQINNGYGATDVSSVYGIQVYSESVFGADYSEYFGISGLNQWNGRYFIDNETPSFTLRALKSLDSIEIKSISFKFTIYQFGNPKKTDEITKVIYFGTYTKSTNIVIDKGVDDYNNVYLSLLNGSDSAQIKARAANGNLDVTYSELGYEVYSVDANNVLSKSEYTGNNLTISQNSETNIFTISAQNKGGVYELVLYAKDRTAEDERVEYRIRITVTDGLSDATAYLIKTLEDFKKLKDAKEDTYYKLWQSINISLLGDDWWEAARVFAGNLNGAITIQNPNTGKTVYRTYSLSGLMISGEHNIFDFGLFNNVTGTIRNVAFEDVKINVTLNDKNTSVDTPVNIGAITAINNGTIENCSVNIVSSTITLLNTANNTKYNIGLIAGTNNGKISYENTNTGFTSLNMVNFASSSNVATALKVIVEQGNTLFGKDNVDNTYINIGGVVGLNSSGANISANYKDKSSNSIDETISVVVNIEFEAGYNASHAPASINSINIGGVSGNNAGEIAQIAMSGSIIANDKCNIGGIAGANTGTLQEVANYGAYLKGYSWKDAFNTGYEGTLTYFGDNATQEQNIGGIVGLNNAGRVDNVRVMFIEFTADEVAVCPVLCGIEGVGNVAGIIGKAINTQLTRAYVENFVTDEITNPNYNIIGINANVAGLIADVNSSSATLSFVQADFNVENCNFYEFGNGLTYNYVYFIGDVLSDNVSIENNIPISLTNHNSSGAGTSYIINNLIYTSNGNILKNVVIDGLEGIELNQNYEFGDYIIQWNQSNEDGVNDNQPYLVYFVKDLNGDYTINGEKYTKVYTLTVQPTDIIVNVDEEYFDENANGDKQSRFEKYEEGLYIQYVNNNSTPDNAEDDEVVSTAIVYYVAGGDNTYKLVSDDKQKGLIEKTVLPNLDAVDGTYSVNIVSGSNIATLTDNGDTITFNGVGKVVLKFVSIFDRTKTDTVTIFVENPLHEDVFEVSASAGLEDRNQDGSRFVTRVGVYSTLTLSIKEVDGQKFDRTKTYMTFEFVEEPDCFTISAVTGSVGLGQIGIDAISLDSTVSHIEVPVTLNVYLNTDNYYIGDKALTELLGDVPTLLASREITIVIYNKATGLSLRGDVTAESGEYINIVATLKTGYVGVIQTDSVSATITGEHGDKLLLDVSNQDTVEYVLTAENENATDLLGRAKETSGQDFSIWNLFEINVVYKLIDGVGYEYSINLRLKEEYRNLNLEGSTDREWRFNLNIVASSNTELTQDVEISFVPQRLISFRLENYSNLVAVSGSSEFVSSESESSIIIPGKSGLVKIFADYKYSYFENIVISSSEVNGVFIRYQQMIYNKDKGVYEPYEGITAGNDNLPLKKVSYIENGQYVYDGVIFVRTIINDVDELVGTRETFTITVNADTYDIDGNKTEISRNKTVVSQYQPGVYVGVENGLEYEYGGKQVYLVEQNSSTTTIVARVFGYEFNVQPQISVTPINDGDSVSAVVIQTGEVTKDITGAYIIKYALHVSGDKPFKVAMQMQLTDNGNDVSSEEKVLSFYPVPYLLKDVYLRGEANGALTIAVNTSKNIDLIWSTNSTTSAKIANINSKLQDLNFLKLFYIDQINSSGQDVQKSFEEYLNSSNTSFSIKENGDDGTYRIESLIKVDPMTAHFNLWYDYIIKESGVEIVFGETREAVIAKAANEDYSASPKCINHNFRLILSMQTTEDAPNPISTAADFMAMYEGENYILMEDITLENWIPLSANFASLDGNGKVIHIKSFNIAVTENVNAGLFETISENTIIKNVVVNISGMQNNLGNNSTALYIKNDNVINSNVNFGLLAGVNNGLIYNCEVISISSARTLEVVVGNGYTLTFGGLVGVNNGNITNSRVGTEYFERLTCTGGVVSSAIVKCGQIYFKAKGVVAGFAGVNNSSRIISSSFVANTSVENISSNGDNALNRTAGFVATNNGTVAYSYVKGLEKNILTTKSTTNATKVGGLECVIYSSGVGSVAGFAYYNTGTIHDCYSNTVCKSESEGVAGFVYNTVNGTIYQCYSASKVDSGDDTLITELPFVGVGVDKDNALQLLSSKNVKNCYYFEDGTEYDDIITDAVKPKGLTLEGFATSSNLNNFSFILDGANEQKLNGVWTYSTGVDRNRSTYSLSSTALPELTSANAISRSIRVFADVQNSSEIKSYKYPAGYELGSKNNPYIIRSVDEYKHVFIDYSSTTTNNKKYNVGYVRFIDDISFKVDDEYINIDTRSNYILGDQANREITVVDGNGMTISDVVINYTEEEKGNLGLFSEVYHSVIKGLQIKYAAQTSSTGGEFGSSTATYVGGVAGIAKNTYFIDLGLTGDVTLRAHNVVGGVVGRLTGKNSGLYNITSNLSVQAGNYADTNIYTSEDDEVAYLSYAGGIAGIIDIGANSSDKTKVNLNKLTINSANVRANRAGGIAGYLGENINAKRLTYVTSNTSQIFGREVAGGIVADNYADIYLSQIGRDAEAQYELDKQFGMYINNKDLLDIDNSTNAYGNLSDITGDEVVGGFIGINYGGNIDNSLTKANIGHNDEYGMAKVAGGFIGKTYGGNLSYVYAQNYIDLIYTMTNADGGTHDEKTETVGGIVGAILKNSTNASTNIFGMDNVVANNWFDKSQLKNLENPIDYIIGKNEDGVDIKKSLSESNTNPIMSYGVFNADEANEAIYQGGKIKSEELGDIAEYYDMEALYYIPTSDNNVGSSTQQEIFNDLFAIWPEQYWYKDYTRFMPNLKDDDSTTFIIIDDADDVKLMEQFPDRSFILVKDVTIDKDANYVVNTNFTGVLIGTKPEGSNEYAKFIINLNASTSNDTGAGFFKQTTGARIANIGFEYSSTNNGGLNLHKEEERDYATVGGVSAKDKDGRFEQVTVMGEVKSKNSAVVNAIGSIVAEGEHTKILSCNSKLKYTIEAGNNSLIGGLVGELRGAEFDDVEGITRYEGLISSSIYSGTMVIIGQGGNIGGIVARAQYTRIGDSSAGRYAIGADNQTSFTISISSTNTNNIGGITNNIGGIIANYINCSVAHCSSNMVIQDKTNNAAAATMANTMDAIYIGGIASRVVNQMDASNGETVAEDNVNNNIEDCYTKLTYSLSNAQNVYIGGIVAEQKSSCAFNIDRTLSEITIGMSTPVNQITLGGIVAKAAGSNNSAGTQTSAIIYCTNINDSMAIINANVNYNNMLVGGGLIGQAPSSYSITNSTATGYIWANSPESPQNTTLTVLGGLVGVAGKVEVNPNTFGNELIDQSIKHSYTTLTMSTAGVYQGTYKDNEDNSHSHDIYTNAIIGYSNPGEEIDTEGVLYSSDYNLTLDEGNTFSEQPKNVTPTVLIANLDTLKRDETTEENNENPKPNNLKGYIGDAWVWSETHLPMPSQIQNMLYNFGIMGYDNDGIMQFKDGNEGKSYCPIELDEKTISLTGTGYTYYRITSLNAISGSLNDLNGVVLGDNSVITANSNMFSNIGAHSAVSNLTIIASLDAEFADGVVALENNGTIFMTGVQYENLKVSDGFGGIVKTNKGTIEYCYNIGNATEVDGGVGGLVHNNTSTASISNSYFTGSFAGGSAGSALAYKNDGYIANSYSAGQALDIIKEEGGRYSNVYYDYYANYITKGKHTEYKAKGLTGISTIELQAISGVEDSAKFAGWKVYSMHNWDTLTRDTNIESTYNYGYPIHNISQLDYSGSGTNLIQIPIRVKRTGNGTFDKLVDENTGDAITDEVYLVDNVVGKLFVNNDEINNIKEYYDNRSFLINNLGVLNLINTLEETANKYFELEVDMVMPEDVSGLMEENGNLLSNWKGLGSDKPFKGVFTSSGAEKVTTLTQDGIRVDVYAIDRTLMDEVDPNENKPIVTNSEPETGTGTTEPETTTQNALNFNNASRITKNTEFKTITNLTGGALFNCIEDGAVITNVVLKNSRINSAPLVNYVGKENNEQEEDDSTESEGTGSGESGAQLPTTIPTIYNVNVVGQLVVNQSNSISGLINQVREGKTLNIYSVKGNNLDDIAAVNTEPDSDDENLNDINILAYNENSKDGATAVSGVVNTNHGTINLKNSYTETTLNIEGADGAAVAGFINSNITKQNDDPTKIIIPQINFATPINLTIEMTLGEGGSVASFAGFTLDNDGIIKTLTQQSDDSQNNGAQTASTESEGGQSTIKIGKVSSAGYIAGLVGTMSGGEIDGFSVSFDSNDGDAYKTDYFGGLVYIITSGNLGSAEGQGLSVKLSTATTTEFGGIICRVNQDGEDSTEYNKSGRIVKVSVNSGNKVVVNNAKVEGDKLVADAGGAFGLIIGKYNAKLGEINYTLAKDISFEVINGQNVGGIIGYAKCGYFNFTNAKPKVTTVYGVGNVGGFIGTYEDDDTTSNKEITIKGNKWVFGIEDEAEDVNQNQPAVINDFSAGEEYKGYAKIEYACPSEPEDEGLTTIISENFGGIIGYWKSTASLSSGSEDKPIINNNIVLSMEIASQLYPGWFNSGTSKEKSETVAQKDGYNIWIHNIGGIVGSSKGSISHAKNNAVIGYNPVLGNNPYGGLNPLYGTVSNLQDPTANINKFMQFVNVGGIVGCVSENEITITSCYNLADIYGMYAVGGLVGYANIVSIYSGANKLTQEEISIERSIYGMIDVGGFVGKATTIKYTAEDNEQSEGEILPFKDVVGLINVGGFIGSATSITIENFKAVQESGTLSQVMGNMNVGGLIGSAGYVNASDVLVGGTIAGTVFDYKHTDEDNNLKPYYYLPNNIGGVIGAFNGGTLNDSSSRFNNVTTEALVRTDTNFGNHSKSGIVSANMTSNYYGINNKYDYSSSLIYNIEQTYTTFTKDKASQPRYDAVDGGIGGFAGKVAEAIDLSKCYVQGDVYAEYGINVGGMVGYLNFNPLSVKLPSVPNKDENNNPIEINVAGKIFVGGYIGKSGGFNGVANFFGDVTTVANINVQQYIELDEDGNPKTENKDGAEVPVTKVLTGSCIGGVIGCVTGNVKNIQLTKDDMNGDGEDKESKLKVYNTAGGYMDSLYVGTLIGCIKFGNMESTCKIAPDLCDAVECEDDNGNKEFKSKYDERFIDSYSPNNVKGIIQTPTTYNYGGLVGLADVKSGSYGDNRLEIAGEHYYAFTVDMVQNRDYDQGASKYSYSEYTDTLTANAHYINTSDICISASGLNALYNYRFKNDIFASIPTGADDHNPTNTKSVGWAKEYTLFRAFARVIEQDEPTGDSVQVIYNAEYVKEVLAYYLGDSTESTIVYTIYQPAGQAARLYCKYGIAEQTDDFDTSNLNIDKGLNQDLSFEHNYELSIDPTVGGGWKGKNKDNEIKYGRLAFWSHISGDDLNMENGKIIYDEQKQSYRINAGEDDDVDVITKKHQLTFGYTYIKRSQCWNSTKSWWEADSEKPKETYFVFNNVFGAVEGSTEMDTSCYSKSGSIFEVSGTTIIPDTDKIKNSEAWIGWVVGAALIIAGVAVGGYFLLPLLAGKLFAGVVLAAAIKFGVTAVYVTGATIILALASGGATPLIMQAVSIGSYEAEVRFNTIQETSLGYLSSSYGRQVGWQNGELSSEFDAFTIIEVDTQFRYVAPNNTSIKLTAYQEGLKQDMKIVSQQNNMVKCTLPLTYFNCTTARFSPSDINEVTHLTIDDFEDVDIKTILQQAGLNDDSTITIPRYYRVDNELYCYSNKEVESKILYPNYEDVKSSVTTEGALLNSQGYAYVLKEYYDSKNKPSIVNGDSELEVFEQFGLRATIENTTSHIVSKIYDDTALELNPENKARLRWREVVGVNVDESKFIYEKTFKFYGTTAPADEYYITRKITEIDGNILKFDGGKVTVDDASNIKVYDTLYFTLNGNGQELKVKLQPYIDGNGLTAEQMGVANSDMYYIISENGQINIKRTYLLCSQSPNLQCDTRGKVYDLTPVPDYAKNSEKKNIQLYGFTKNGDNFEFYAANKTSLSQILSWIETDNSQIYALSLSNKYMQTINDTYGFIKGDNGWNKLCFKNLNTTYMAKEIGNKWYFYKPVYKDVDGGNHYNRYVYNDILEEDGTKVKFYTRFHYGDNFFDTKITIGDERLFSDLLLPSNGTTVDNKEIIFSEGVRVSLSPIGARIWRQYPDSYGDCGRGSITCYSEFVTQN